MTLQDIITYSIVAFAGMIALNSLYHALFPGKQNKHATGCSSTCSCDAVKLRKELLINVKKR